MKYAIRMSHLPPVVLYVETRVPVGIVLREMDRCQSVGMVQRIINVIELCKVAGWSCELVEDETAVVFTDPRDADYLITPVNGVWSAHRCK